MKNLILLQFILFAGAALGQCHPPGQGHLEGKLREIFLIKQGEDEVREWVSHPKNVTLREEIKSLDRRSKFSDRTTREEIQLQAKDKFEIMIHNNGRSNEISDFPTAGAHSSLTSSKGAIDIEMTSLPKDGLEVFPPEILAKISPKVKISYMYPYDKFQHVLTYDNKELPMDKALGKIQQDMESNCEVRMIENGEYRKWYEKNHGGGGSSSSSSSSSSGSKGGAGTSKGQ